MRRDAQLIRMLRQATRAAVRDLDHLKLVTPDRNPEIARLRQELDLFVLKHHARIAKEARSASSQAKESSHRHRVELAEMKKVAEQSAEKFAKFRQRNGHSENTRAA